MAHNDPHVRLRRMVTDAYTQTYTSRAGILRKKGPTQCERESLVAHTAVDFAADFHPAYSQYMTPAALWSALMNELIADGTLVRHPVTGVLRHRYDEGNLATIARIAERNPR